MSKHDKIGVNKRTALKMFFDAGYNTEAKLAQAAKILEKVKPVADGYYLAEDVSIAIDKERKNNPLKPGKSRNVISKNIATEVRKGHPPKQAAAIALRVAKVPKKAVRKKGQIEKALDYLEEVLGLHKAPVRAKSKSRAKNPPARARAVRQPDIYLVIVKKPRAKSISGYWTGKGWDTEKRLGKSYKDAMSAAAAAEKMKDSVTASGYQIGVLTSRPFH